MATPVGRIEKEFLFKALYGENMPVIYLKDRIEYKLKLEYPASEELVFRPEKPMGKMKPHVKLPLLFNFRGQIIDFSVEFLSQKNELLFCKAPDMLYKNLDRNYLRVDAPSDLKVLFCFQGDRYNLAFPKTNEYETITAADILRNMDTSNLSVLIKQITALMSKFADGFKIVNFKDKAPEALEEKIVAQTGKTLFLPTTAGFFPKTDPYPKKRIITEEIFKRYIESEGVGKDFLNENCMRFLKNKFDENIYSDAWVPILFHEYVIGYIHTWINNQSRNPFDFNVLDNVYQYAKVLAFGLRENGYFDYGKVANEPFEGRVLDISASGLLFAYPLGTSLLATLLVDAELTVIINAPNRTLNLNAKIVRRFNDNSASYFGCRFINMAPEDMRFIFEYLYGRKIDSKDTEFLTGQV